MLFRSTASFDIAGELWMSRLNYVSPQSKKPINLEDHVFCRLVHNGITKGQNLRVPADTLTRYFTKFYRTSLYATRNAVFADSNSRHVRVDTVDMEELIRLLIIITVNNKLEHLTVFSDHSVLIAAYPVLHSDFKLSVVFLF